MRGNSYKSKRKTRSINKLIFIVPIIFIAAIVLINLANGNIQKLAQAEGQEALKAGTTPTRVVIRDTSWSRDLRW